MKLFTMLCSLLLLTTAAVADEAYYRDKFCTSVNGITESYVHIYRWRVDCETKTTVYEVDRANKRDEALGQVLRYARVTGKQPGIVLIVKTDKDRQYLQDLKDTVGYWKLPVTIESVTD